MKGIEFGFENESGPRMIKAPEKIGKNYEKTTLFNEVGIRSVVTTGSKCNFPKCKMHMLVVTSPDVWQGPEDGEPEEYSVQDLEDHCEGWFIVVKDGKYSPLIE